MDVSANVNVALLLTLLAGLSTGIGSSIAYFIKKPRIAYLSFGLGLSAGVMIYISLDELLPMAHRYGHGHLVIGGIVAGMLVMAISLLML
jgi:ZIP family zinc transporter